MSRRRHTGRPVPPPPPANDSHGATIRVNLAGMQIGDLVTLVTFSQLQHASEAEQVAALVEAIPLLDRIVVGGVSGRPLSDLQPVMAAVNGAMNRSSDPNG